MANRIYVTLTILVITLSIIASKRHVIKVSGNWIDLGSVMAEAVVNSADECASLCTNTIGCGSSMLLGQRCILHGKLCQCPEDAIRPSANISSCYKIMKQPLLAISDGWQRAQSECAELGMYLLAINSAAEQELIEQMMAEHDPDCLVIYTSGYSPVPGSTNMADWRWVITPYHSEPLTYTNWIPGQPDNWNGNGQDVIGLMATNSLYMYRWADLARSHTDKKRFCQVCECTGTGCT